jgi:hypothetical protein
MLPHLLIRWSLKSPCRIPDEKLINQARVEIERVMRQLKIEADLEIGSASVSEFVYGHAARFAADLLIIGPNAVA